MNFVQLQEGTKELINNRATFDEEYFQMLPRSSESVNRNGVEMLMSGDDTIFSISLNGKDCHDEDYNIEGKFETLQQVKSFVHENFSVFTQLFGNYNHQGAREYGYENAYMSLLDGFTYREIGDIGESRNAQFHFFANWVCRLYYGNNSQIANQIGRYTSDKVSSTIAVLEERYIPEEYQERFKKATNFYSTELNAKKHLGRLFQSIENKEALMNFLEENIGDVSICYSIDKGVSVDFLSTVINGLTKTGRQYFKQITDSGGKDCLFETLSKLNPELVLNICNSVGEIPYNTNRNPFTILLSQGLDSEAIANFLNFGTAEEVIQLLEDELFIRIIQKESCKKNLEAIFGNITTTDFIKVKKILLIAMTNVSNPDGNGGANLISDNLPNILEKIPEFEEFEEHDSEETGRILILWSYTPEKITNVNIRNYLIERANTKVGIIDEEIAKQESLKKAETDSITRLSGENK